MKAEKIISEIIICIEKAHEFSKNLDGVSSINRDYLVNNLKHINSTDIHLALLELNENNKIEYNIETGIVTIINLKN
jgi:hypothetical protein